MYDGRKLFKSCSISNAVLVFFRVTNAKISFNRSFKLMIVKIITRYEILNLRMK